MGISWFLTEIQGQKAVFHNGGDDGFLTRFELFPERKTAVVSMINCYYADPKAMDAVVLDAALGLGGRR